MPFLNNLTLSIYDVAYWSCCTVNLDMMLLKDCTSNMFVHEYDQTHVCAHTKLQPTTGFRPWQTLSVLTQAALQLAAAAACLVTQNLGMQLTRALLANTFRSMIKLTSADFKITILMNHKELKLYQGGSKI